MPKQIPPASPRTLMTPAAASRIQAATARLHGGRVTPGGFAPRAQSAAAKNAGGKGR